MVFLIHTELRCTVNHTSDLRCQIFLRALLTLNVVTILSGSHTNLTLYKQTCSNISRNLRDTAALKDTNNRRGQIQLRAVARFCKSQPHVLSDTALRGDTAQNCINLYPTAHTHTHKIKPHAGF